jgi:hypothetical protein
MLNAEGSTAVGGADAFASGSGHSALRIQHSALMGVM